MLIKTRKQRLSKHFFLYANCSLFKKRTPCTILFFLNYETISNSHLRGIITLTVNFIRSTFKTNCFFPKISVFLPSRSIPLVSHIRVSQKYEVYLSLSPTLLFTIECICHHRGARLLPTDRCLRVFIYFMDDVGWRHLATVKCFS